MIRDCKHSQICRSAYLIIICVLVLASCVDARSEARREYELVWQDDFNGHEIDTTAWSYLKRIPYNCGRYWSSHPSLYSVGGGKLRLYARQNKGIALEDTARYLTAGITTEHKQTVAYGKIEVRARMKGGIGTWPAIWTLRDDGQNHPKKPGYAELDILEYVNRNNFVYQTLHTYYTLQQGTPHKQVKPRVKPEKWNTYAVEILPDRVIYSVNGDDTFTYYRQPELEEQGQWPFGPEMYLMIDMQVGGSGWVPVVDPKTFPAYMDIDWVRMYRLVE